jgi:hypothetical protein
MQSVDQHTEQHVRIFRDNPFAWYDKEVMRYLRGKYGKDKKTFLILRAVYTALTEIESDFKDAPIGFFTKTVGTYAGVSREVAGKYLNLLEREGLIIKTRERDPNTRKFLPGTTVRILSLQHAVVAEDVTKKHAPEHQQKKPVSGYPSTGVPQRWDTPASNKKIVSSSEITSNVNENFPRADTKRRSSMQGIGSLLKQFDTQKKHSIKPKPHKEKPEDIIRRDFLAEEMATSLGDQKSLGAFRKIAERIPEAIIRDYLAQIKETWHEGKVKKSRGALFISMIQQYTASHRIDLGFQSGG